MVVMEDVTEEERSAELYVSVHGGLDHTFLNFVLRVVHTFKFLPLQVNIRSSFSMFWPEVKLLGCYVNFSQLMWKRVKGDVYCVCQLANWTKIHLFVFDDDLINRGCILMVLIRLLYQVPDMQEIMRKRMTSVTSFG